MDRPLDEGFRRARTLKRVAAWAGGAAVVVALFVWAPGWISPSISRSRIRMARVDVGPIEAVIEASGTVVPEIEEVVSSPVDARVVRILQRAGADLQPGEPLVELDARESALAVERLSQDLALKSNQQEKTRLELERSLNDLDSQARVKDLQLQAYRSQLARNQALSKEGLISEEVLKQSELAEAQAVVELKKIQIERENAQRMTRTTLDGLALEMGTLRKEAEEARRQLDARRAQGRAPRRPHLVAVGGGDRDPQGRRHRPHRRPLVLPRGRDALRRARQAGERRPPGDRCASARRRSRASSRPSCRRSRTA